MADTLPINIPIPTEGAVASYSWTDIAAGTGIIDFYGTPANPSTGNIYLLLTNAYPGGGTGGSTLYDASVNFESEAFNTPRTINGTAYATGQLYTDGGAVQVTITLYKVSGGSATAISSAVSTPSYTAGYKMVLPITLTTTNFGIGDYLRAAVTVTSANSARGLYVNPSGTTQPFIISVPFKVAL